MYCPSFLKTELLTMITSRSEDFYKGPGRTSLKLKYLNFQNSLAPVVYDLNPLLCRTVNTYHQKRSNMCSLPVTEARSYCPLLTQGQIQHFLLPSCVHPVCLKEPQTCRNKQYLTNNSIHNCVSWRLPSNMTLAHCSLLCLVCFSSFLRWAPVRIKVMFNDC